VHVQAYWAAVKIRILSDIHLEFFGWTPPPVDADVVVLAGDIHVGTNGIEWARHHFPATRVIYVPGNHEFYGGNVQEVLETLRKEARRFRIDLLDGDELTTGGVRFLGATLWTDFALYGSGPVEISRAMAHGQQRVADFHAIRQSDGGPFRPEHARAIHLAQVNWLQGKLAEMTNVPTVVVTHYLPHRLSIHAKFEGDPLNPCFASDLDHLVRAPVALWIHGHTHESMDYTVNATRVLCNPRGYIPMEPNPVFNSTFTTDLEALK
jgi:predicted phosphodiesterase